MPPYNESGHADAQIRESSRHYARLGTGWFAFAQVVFVACHVLVGGGDELTEDLDVIDIAAGVAGLTTLVFIAFVVLSLRPDRAGDIPPHTRDRRLADQQSAWIAVTFFALGEIVLAIAAVVTVS